MRAKYEATYKTCTDGIDSLKNLEWYKRPTDQPKTMTNGYDFASVVAKSRSSEIPGVNREILEFFTANCDAPNETPIEGE